MWVGDIAMQNALRLNGWQKKTGHNIEITLKIVDMQRYLFRAAQLKLQPKY